MRKYILVAAIGVFSATGFAMAQQAQSMNEGQLNQLDADKSGGVSKAEYEVFMTAAFAKLDANGNGTLTIEETSQVLTPAQFAALDANGNGSVDKKEFMAQVMKDFASADKGGDGELK